MKTALLLVLILMSPLGLRAAGDENQTPFDLTTILGESFQHCRILKATPEGITISHESGVSKIPFENLSDEWKKLFHYSPDKASAFQKEEAGRRALAEEKRRQAQQEYEKNRQQAGAIAAVGGRKMQKLEDIIALEQVGIVAASVASQPGLMFPLPGDPALFLGAGMMATRTSTVVTTGSAVQATTEVVIPPTTPIGQIYTPGATTSQSYIINQGAVFTPGDGTIYSVYPGYVNYFTPGCVNPPIVICPPGTTRPNHPINPVSPVRPTPGVTVGPVVIRPRR